MNSVCVQWSVQLDRQSCSICTFNLDDVEHFGHLLNRSRSAYVEHCPYYYVNYKLLQIIKIIIKFDYNC